MSYDEELARQRAEQGRRSLLRRKCGDHRGGDGPNADGLRIGDRCHWFRSRIAVVKYLQGAARTLEDVDGKCDDLETARLDDWWRDLSDAQRRKAFDLAPHNPMPPWMIDSLNKAEISGLVERPGEPDDMPPWIAMPDHVARLVARHRRGGGTYSFQLSTRKRR